MTLFEPTSIFLLGITSLLPLINPIGTALILNSFFAGQDLKGRKSYALSIVMYSFFLGLGALFLGSWCLKFMGISVSTTQLAGGIIIARMGLNLLSSKTETDKSDGPLVDLKSSTFYPMAFPLTLGPGAISVLITLNAHAQSGSLSDTWLKLVALTLSLAFVCVVTYFCFVYSDKVISKIGTSGSLVANRLSAFLVFCIGVQMTLTAFKTIFRNYPF